LLLSAEPLTSSYQPSTASPQFSKEGFVNNLTKSKGNSPTLVPDAGLIKAELDLDPFEWASLSSALDARYASLYTYVNPQEASLSGRAKIMALDLEIFRDNFLMGVGPGAARDLRWKYGYGTVVGAHSEFTRMLAEHGLFGLISLLSILILSLKEYQRRIDYNKVILSCLSIFELDNGKIVAVALSCRDLKSIQFPP